MELMGGNDACLPEDGVDRPLPGAIADELVPDHLVHACGVRQSARLQGRVEGAEVADLSGD